MIRSSNTSSDNIVAMSSGALHHAHREIFSPWQETHREIGARGYDWWTMAVVSTIPEWRDYCRAYAAWHSLHMGNFDLLVYENGTDTTSRDRNSGLNGYTGPASQPAASRMIWGRRSVPFGERNPGGRIVAKRGLRNDHNEIGWAGHLLADNISMFDFGGDPIAAMSRLPVRSGQWFRTYRWPNGDRFSICRHNTANTRGPVGASMLSNGVLTMYSPSRDTGSGAIWSRVVGSVTDDRWTLVSGSREMSGAIAPGAEIILWDQHGARILNQEPEEPEELPRRIPETAQGLAAFDAGGRKIAAQGDAVRGPERDDVLRSLAELMRLCTEGSRASAADGTVDTLDKMHRLGWMSGTTFAKLKALAERI